MHLSLEEHLSSTCPNCGREHEAKFFSLFLGHRHYVIGDCAQCGYRIEIRRDDLGMGLFLPDGSVSTVKQAFQTKHTDHMKEALAESAPHVGPTHANVRMRMVEKK